MKTLLKLVWRFLVGATSGAAVGGAVFGGKVLVERLGPEALFFLVPIGIGAAVATIHHFVVEYG